MVRVMRSDRFGEFPVQLWIGRAHTLYMAELNWGADALDALSAAAGRLPTSTDEDDLTFHELARRYPGVFPRVFAGPTWVWGTLVTLLAIALIVAIDAIV